MAGDTDIDERVQHWLDEIEASKEREKEYRKMGRLVRAIYGAEKKAETPFNVLFSNCETMLPAVYSQLPRPVVSYRYKDGDPLGKAASTAGQRMLEFLLDTNIDGYETSHESLKGAVLDALLPGRGVASVKYDAEDYGELVCTELNGWDRVHMGFARSWSKVPWIAYEKHVDEAECVRLLGKEIASKIEFSTGEDKDEDDETVGGDRTMRMGKRKTACLYQIWDRAGGKKVRWISPQYKDAPLREDDDPLGLTGFFNTPRPLQFVEKTHDLVPVALYSLYEQQAAELNEITRRLNKLIKACKWRGLYDGELGDDIANLLESNENEFVATDKGSSLAADKGLDKAIWTMPLDALIQTIRELYAAREQVKQVIYEILGISDILRGATKASETLGAQQIKSTWGSLRLKPKQAEVQRYARDILRMMLEIAATKFEQETWAKATGLPFWTDDDLQKAQMMAQQMQGAAQSGDPQALQAFQQLQQQMAQTPKWSDVLGLLQDDMQRAFRIDIETNSTIEPEAAEDQKQITDLLTALGQFVQGIGPMVQQGIVPFEMAKNMMLTITKRFRFGSEIEDQIRAMQPPPPQDNGAEKKAADAEAKAKEQALSLKEQQAQAQVENTTLRGQLQAEQKARELDKRDTELKLREIAIDQREAQLKMEQKAAQESLQTRSQVENVKLDAKRREFAVENKNADTKLKAAVHVDAKTEAAVKQLGTMIEQLVLAIGQQNETTQTLLQATKAPRKRVPIRDPKTNRIIEVRDEVLQ